MGFRVPFAPLAQTEMEPVWRRLAGSGQIEVDRPKRLLGKDFGELLEASISIIIDAFLISATLGFFIFMILLAWGNAELVNDFISATLK